MTYMFNLDGTYSFTQNCTCCLADAPNMLIIGRVIIFQRQNFDLNIRPFLS